MTETRKLAAILAANVVGYSYLAGADEDRTLARLRGLRSDLIDPAISAHRGRVVKCIGDGILIEFRSVVDAVRCAIEVQNGMVERNAGLPLERRIEFQIGIHLGDIVVGEDGDLMGDGANIAARLENICEPGAICLSEDAYRQVRARLDLAVSDLGETQFKNIELPMRVYALQVGMPAQAKTPAPAIPPESSVAPRLAIVVLPVLIVILCLAVPLAKAQAAGQWLRCTLTKDIMRDSSGRATTTVLNGSSVIFIINDEKRTFYTYRDDTQTLTELRADVQAREVTFFDGPLSDTISRVTGTFNVVASPYHEAHGRCVPINPMTKDKPKF
jgi:adenylate cyclase